MTPRDSQGRQKTFLLGSRTVVSGHKKLMMPPVLPPATRGCTSARERRSLTDSSMAVTGFHCNFTLDLEGGCRAHQGQANPLSLESSNCDRLCSTQSGPSIICAEWHGLCACSRVNLLPEVRRDTHICAVNEGAGFPAMGPVQATQHPSGKLTDSGRLTLLDLAGESGRPRLAAIDPYPWRAPERTILASA